MLRGWVWRDFHHILFKKKFFFYQNYITLLIYILNVYCHRPHDREAIFVLFAIYKKNQKYKKLTTLLTELSWFYTRHLAKNQYNTMEFQYGVVAGGEGENIRNYQF